MHSNIICNNNCKYYIYRSDYLTKLHFHVTYVINDKDYKKKKIVFEKFSKNYLKVFELYFKSSSSSPSPSLPAIESLSQPCPHLPLHTISRIIFTQTSHPHISLYHTTLHSFSAFVFPKDLEISNPNKSTLLSQRHKQPILPPSQILAIPLTYVQINT